MLSMSDANEISAVPRLRLLLMAMGLEGSLAAIRQDCPYLPSHTLGPALPAPAQVFVRAQ